VSVRRQLMTATDIDSSQNVIRAGYHNDKGLVDVYLRSEKAISHTDM